MPQLRRNTGPKKADIGKKEWRFRACRQASSGDDAGAQASDCGATAVCFVAPHGDTFVFIELSKEGLDHSLDETVKTSHITERVDIFDFRQRWARQVFRILLWEMTL